MLDPLMANEIKTLHATEFKAPCTTCKREVDILSRRIVGDGRTRGEPGLVVSRHLASSGGWCAGSMLERR